MRSGPDRARLAANARLAKLALASGLSIELVLTILDIWLDPPNPIIGIIVIAPLVCALFGTPRAVAIVAGGAIALAIASGVWRENLGSTAHLQRVFVVSTVGLLALMAARGRMRVGRDRERFAVLAAVADIADGTRSLGDTVAGLNNLVVPAVADVCIVDAVSQGELRRLAVRCTAPDGDAIAAELTAQGWDRPDDDVEGRQAHLHTHLPPGLREHDIAAVMVLPLRARGRRLGSLTLMATAQSGRRYDQEDLEFARVLAGRAALALDNAGLFSELETIEAQLTAALSTLAEAVTVQHAAGALIYANDAAAKMLGYRSAQELLATPVGEIVSRYDSTLEDGSRLRMEDLPGRRVIAGLEPTPLVVRAVHKQTGEESWRVTKASGVYGRAGELKLVVNVIEDITDVKRAEIAQRLLARAGEALASSLDYEHTLQKVAELAVPQLADWCSVSMPDRHGFIRTVAVAHVDPDKVALAHRVGERYPTLVSARTGTAQVLRDGSSQVVNEISDELLAAVAVDGEHLELLRSVGLRAGLTVPMTTGSGKIVGTLSLVSAESGRRFSDADVALAEELARRGGTAVENARLYTERSHIARTLQTGLLPGRLPHMPGWSTASLYRPAGDENSVGGDFYDAFAVQEGWLALVGDVAGRGAEAATLTGMARYTLRTAATLLRDPLSAVGTLNGELRAREEMSLCSVAAMHLRERDGVASAEVLCAGHPLPMLVRDGEVTPLGEFGPVLGAYVVDEWKRTTVQLRVGDVLVLYTDGVFDAVGECDRFGEERLERTLTSATGAQDAIARIDTALSDFEVGEQADDTAVLAVELVSVPAPSASPISRSERRA